MTMTAESHRELIDQVRELARTREHRIAVRQLNALGSQSVASLHALHRYLSGRPERAAASAPADVAAQVGHATQAAMTAMQGRMQAETDQSHPRPAGVPASDVRTQRAPAAERLRDESDEGYYLHDGRMYKVATSQYGASQGHLFARKLNEETGDWERAQGMTSYLRKSEKVTLEQAVEFGRQLEVTPQMALYGRCWICHKVLTDEESIKNRVGPGPHRGIDA